ncbi:MAG: hypothetical protein ACRD3E_18705, partial [Terriglobales bacterium]
LSPAARSARSPASVTVHVFSSFPVALPSDRRGDCVPHNRPRAWTNPEKQQAFMRARRHVAPNACDFEFLSTRLPD